MWAAPTLRARWAAWALRVLRRRSAQAAAVLVALVLGLLSPLSCVIHCAVVEWARSTPEAARFLCGEHARQAPLALTTPPADEPAPGAPTPRALYELVLSAVALPALALLATTLALRGTRRSSPPARTPPTPPPRLTTLPA